MSTCSNAFNVEGVVGDCVVNFTLDFINRHKEEFNVALIRITNTESDLLSILRCLDEDLYIEIVDKPYRKVICNQIKKLYFTVLQPLYWRTSDENHQIRELMDFNKSPAVSWEQMGLMIEHKREKVLAETWERFNRLVSRCISMGIPTEELKTVRKIYDNYSEEDFYELYDSAILDYIEANPLKCWNYS